MTHLIKPTTSLCGKGGMMTHDDSLVDCPSCKWLANRLRDHDGHAPEDNEKPRTYFDGRVVINPRRVARTASHPVVD